MYRKDNPYYGMTVYEFIHLLPKQEREQFKRYIAQNMIKHYEVEA